jgi:hypothetical protein
VCYVKEFVVAPPEKTIRCEQDEYHCDTSHVSANSARRGEKMSIIRREQASSVHTTQLISERFTQRSNTRSIVTHAVCTVISSIVVYPHHRCNTLMLSYDRPAIGDNGVFLSARNMARHMLHRDTLHFRSTSDPGNRL